MVKERASLEEVLAFANKVREAGGGNPLDALMPAVPEDAHQCLIAKNLNFNCAVDLDDNSRWRMSLDDERIRDRIADSLGLRSVRGTDEDAPYAVLLPPEIGAVAAAFDDTSDALGDISYFLEENEDGSSMLEELEDGKRKLVEEFWPYIEASTKEAYDLATIVNPDGSIVI